jgi:putative transposase
VRDIGVIQHRGGVRLPKIGKIKAAWSRELPAQPSSVTLILEATGEFYVSFVVDVPDAAGIPDEAVATDRIAGIVLGLKYFASIAYSDGTRERIANPRHYRAAQRHLGRAQQKLSRAKRGSRNRAKAKLAVAKVHARTPRLSIGGATSVAVNAGVLVVEG